MRVITLNDDKYAIEHDNGKLSFKLRGEAWRAANDILDIGIVLALVQRIEELEDAAVPKCPAPPTSALASQIGGNHYKELVIQPVEYIHANNIPFCEGSAIKYLTRWRDKGGVPDLEKAKHFIEILIDLERAK